MILLAFCKVCRNEAFDFTPSILQLIIPIVLSLDFEFLTLGLDSLVVLSGGLESENGDLP